MMELTRFYLQLKEDPHGPNVALFVGNLPPNLSQKQYETILLEYLDDGKHEPKKLHRLEWGSLGKMRTPRSNILKNCTKQKLLTIQYLQTFKMLQIVTLRPHKFVVVTFYHELSKLQC